MKNRPVIIFNWDRSTLKNGKYLKKEIGTGVFHQWGCAYEEFEEGAGNYSTAIIETPDGTALNLDVELIKFTDRIEVTEDAGKI